MDEHGDIYGRVTMSGDISPRFHIPSFRRQSLVCEPSILLFTTSHCVESPLPWLGTFKSRFCISAEYPRPWTRSRRYAVQGGCHVEQDRASFLPRTLVACIPPASPPCPVTPNLLNRDDRCQFISHAIRPRGTYCSKVVRSGRNKLTKPPDPVATVETLQLYLKLESRLLIPK
jgi:hypothetical protein